MTTHMYVGWGWGGLKLLLYTNYFKWFLYALLCIIYSKTHVVIFGCLPFGAKVGYGISAQNIFRASAQYHVTSIRSVWIVYAHTCSITYAHVCTHPIFKTYFPAFEACVREGRVASIMCSLNAVNGVPSCANDLFQNQVVRDQWGFQGFIVSGCGVAVLLSDWLFETQHLQPT